jgi:hypothetical protein
MLHSKQATGLMITQPSAGCRIIERRAAFGPSNCPDTSEPGIHPFADHGGLELGGGMAPENRDECHPMKLRR